MAGGSAPGSENRAAHVLVVDDDPDLRWVVETALRRRGYAVASAVDGRDAIRRLCEQRPDVLLLDLHMPVMDGWRLQAWLRVRAHEIPIVLMSADPRAWSASAIRQADGYLAKPFGLDDLFRAVKRLVRPPSD